MSVSSYLTKRLLDLLDERRIVVWYDGERAFETFAADFKAPSCKVVSAAESILRARREAEEIYQKMNDSPDPRDARANMMIYVPRFRGSIPETKQRDPFEVFAVAGAAFGDKDAERLQSLGRQALPDRIAEIDRLFSEAKPTLALLDSLESDQRWPLLREALGTESAVEILAQILCRDARAARIEEVPGCKEEVLRLLEDAFGFKPPARARSWQSIRESLGIYVLLSEFAFDLPTALPDALAAVPHAEPVHRERILAACERMRTGDDFRERYITLADHIEAELRLPAITEGIEDLGPLDTFAFEERQYLIRLRERVKEGDLSGARSILENRRRSIWRHRPDRALLWIVAERCVGFLEMSKAVEESWSGEASSVRSMVEAYARPGGWAELDSRQRLFEQSAAGCSEDAEILPLIEMCRGRYRAVVQQIQDRFLSVIHTEGWPPDGVLRQTQVFDRLVAPVLEKRERVAFFLCDALRFEMGRNLGEALVDLGEVDTSVAASVLPTTTPCGMAALMPGADGAFSLVESGGDLVPAIGSRHLKNSDDRMKFLKERYGDRFADLTLDDLLSTPVKKLEKKFENADLLVVRAQGIDALGENLSLYLARKLMSEMLGELKKAAVRLAAVGYQHLVFSADHGHVLLPEVPPGDVVGQPPGTWLKSTRRCRLGKGLAATAGTLVFPANLVGIQGTPEEICFPVGFRVFIAGEGYFHEGLSLQEAVVPAVAVHVRAPAVDRGKQEVSIWYRSDRFTSRVIGLKVQFRSLVGEPVRVRIEAYDSSAPKAKIVGEAADCEARDESTYEVTLKPRVETAVPVLIEPDFMGPSVEIRVTDPRTGQIWTRHKLKNALIE
ncbi:MAG: PglZ domain-containing protein [Candidatus Krumholzibacteria bacterium]